MPYPWPQNVVSYGITLGLKYTVKRERLLVAYLDDFADKSGHDYLTAGLSPRARQRVCHCNITMS
ncbi:MAG: hypothetical protein MZV63_55175 [Marinilabiliales bacterium]|nr:hypothetical protein [Marinilabiliales bacterium]